MIWPKAEGLYRDRRVDALKRSRSRFLGRLATAVLVFVNLPGWADAVERRAPTVAETLAIAEVAWRYPPTVFDITVITTMNRPQEDESAIRRAIAETHEREHKGLPQDVREEALETEIKRQIDLNKVPFVRKERWRSKGLDFCVDLAHMDQATDVLGAETPFDECLLFLQKDVNSEVVSARRGYGTKTLGIDAPENAWRIERSDVWEGGAFSFRCVLLLKTLFGWPAITESNPGLDEARIAAITSGGAGGVKLTVSESGSKKTFVVSGWDAVATFTCQGESILPIMEEVVTNAFGQVVSRMTVTELNAAGEPVEFEMLGPPKRMNEPAIPVKVRVLARQIGGDLPADTFSLDRPEGWSKWDGRTRELIFFDGTPREAPPRLAAPTVANPSNIKRILFLTNAAVLVALAASWGWRYLRGRSAPVSRAGKPTPTELSE
jgi:hypothetical protein